MAKRLLIAAVVSLVCVLAQPQPPVAKKLPTTRQLFGETVVDNYAWLHNKSDPDTLAYVQAENAYLVEATQALEPLKFELYDEIAARRSSKLSGPPIAINGYLYYRRTSSDGVSYSVWLRRPVGSAEEVVILDENQLAADSPYFSLGALAVSPNGQYLAYASDYVGNLQHVLRIKDLRNGQVLSEVIDGVYDSVEWSSDSQYLFYNVIHMQSGQPLWIKRHQLGTEASTDVVVMSTENDLSYMLDITTSSDGKYFLLARTGMISSEVYFLDKSDPLGTFTVICPLVRGTMYTAQHWSGLFLLLTNANGAYNYAIVTVPVPPPGEPVDQTATITILPNVHMSVYSKYMLVYQLQDALYSIVVFDISRLVEAGGNMTAIPTPFSIPLPSGFLHVADWQQEQAVFKYQTYEDVQAVFLVSSLIMPDTLLVYTFATSIVVELEKMTVANYDDTQYTEDRIEVPSTLDGQWIPVTIAFRSTQSGDLPANQPMLLAGFGAFGDVSGPRFNPTVISLLDRNIVYGFAHVRGDGLLGPLWHADGRLLQKRNTFADYDTCAKYLIRIGVTSSDRLGVMGSFAGGLVAGVTMTQYPQLVRLVVADVPFVDAVNTMLDPTAPWTVYEYDEWGNPQNETVYRYMSSYDPYTQLRQQEYPPRIYFSAAWEDSIVPFHEAAKVVAKLRTVATNAPDKSTFLLHTLELGSHYGGSGENNIEDMATMYAFIIDSIAPPGDCTGSGCARSSTELAIIIGSVSFVVLFLAACGFVTYRIMRSRKRAQYATIKDGTAAAAAAAADKNIQQPQDEWMSDGSDIDEEDDDDNRRP